MQPGGAPETRPIQAAGMRSLDVSGMAPHMVASPDSTGFWEDHPGSSPADLRRLGACGLAASGLLVGVIAPCQIAGAYEQERPRAQQDPKKQTQHPVIGLLSERVSFNRSSRMECKGRSRRVTTFHMVSYRIDTFFTGEECARPGSASHLESQWTPLARGGGHPWPRPRVADGNGSCSFRRRGR